MEPSGVNVEIPGPGRDRTRFSAKNKNWGNSWEFTA